MMCLLSLVVFVPKIDWKLELPAPAPRGAFVRRDGSILIPGRADDRDARLVCFQSKDEGQTWVKSGTIASDPERRTDIGDGNIVADRKGELFAVYRHNHHGPSTASPDFAIEVSASDDGGETWSAHSTVATSRPDRAQPSRGLWSPHLFVTKSGDLQCYYDDEDTPYREGFPGHQWLTMKTYSRSHKRWESPVTVSRSHDPKLLSRDGMASVVETTKGQLLCALESVETAPPHAGLIRMVTSSDNGRTWSWQREERKVLYEPRDRRYHAFSPALVLLSKNAVLATFATNEDRAEPGISGTPPRELSLDIKYVGSLDNGKSWETSATLLYGGSHRNYLPGVVRLPGKGLRLLTTFLDFDRGSLSKAGSAN